MGVKLNSTGGGSVHLEAPVTAANRTVTVPDVDGTLLVSSTDGSSIISANSATDALRITQTGTGNALLVEDSANPDSSPFVIDTDGRVISGSATYQGYAGAAPYLQVNNTGASTSAIGVSRWVASAVAGQLQLAKSRGAAVGTRGIVSSGDDFGSLTWAGDDGTNFVLGASIAAQVDGTPGTNDMPGRLVFSTTADGASTPTERMRIRNDGNIGFGGGGNSAVSFYNQKNITGGTAAYSMYTVNTIQSDVTSIAYGNRTSISTAAASFTLNSIAHFAASQGTIGAGSTVTNQYGFIAQTGLTGATNNYGFYGDIASGTGRWNFYAAGTADNYFAGDVLLGSITKSTSTPRLEVVDSSRHCISIGDDVIDATTKYGTISSRHYTNSEKNVCIVRVTNSSTSNLVTIGGADSGLNCATSIVFTTAANTTTVTGTTALTIDSNQSTILNGGLSIASTAVTAPSALDGNVFSGTYTPTLTNSTNVAASTAYQCQYMRVGNVVTVSGILDIDPTASGAFEIRMTLPISSSFTTTRQAGGIANSNADLTSRINSVASTSLVQLLGTAVSTANQGTAFSFTYQVL